MATCFHACDSSREESGTAAAVQVDCPFSQGQATSLEGAVEILKEILLQQRKLVEIQQAHLKLATGPVDVNTSSCQLAVVPPSTVADIMSNVPCEPGCKKISTSLDSEPTQDEQVVRESLSVAMWEAETELHEDAPADSNSVFPKQVPSTCTRIVHAVGVVQCGRSVFRSLHHAFIVSCSVWAFIYAILNACAAQGKPVPTLLAFSYAYLAAIALLGRFIWRKQFANNGAAMLLLQRLLKRPYPWYSLKSKAWIFWITAPCFVMVSILRDAINLMTIRDSYEFVKFFEPKLKFLGETAAPYIINTIIVFGDLSIAFLFFLVIGHIWVCHFACEAHCMNMKRYAGAVVRAVQGDLDMKKVVSAFSELEKTISYDLLHASQTWVAYIVSMITGVGVILLVGIALLLKDVTKGPAAASVHMLISIVILCSLFVFSSSWPLVMVRASYETDVRRSLNCPQVMRDATELFSSQLLDHLHYLNWGFEVGGVVLSVSIFTDFGKNVVLALCVAVSNAAFKFAS